MIMDPLGRVGGPAAQRRAPCDLGSRLAPLVQLVARDPLNLKACRDIVSSYKKLTGYKGEIEIWQMKRHSGCRLLTAEERAVIIASRRLEVAAYLRKNRRQDLSESGLKKAAPRIHGFIFRPGKVFNSLFQALEAAGLPYVRPRNRTHPAAPRFDALPLPLPAAEALVRKEGMVAAAKQCFKEGLFAQAAIVFGEVFTGIDPYDLALLCSYYLSVLKRDFPFLSVLAVNQAGSLLAVNQIGSGDQKPAVRAARRLEQRLKVLDFVGQNPALECPDLRERKKGTGPEAILCRQIYSWLYGAPVAKVFDGFPQAKAAARVNTLTLHFFEKAKQDIEAEVLPLGVELLGVAVKENR